MSCIICFGNGLEYGIGINEEHYVMLCHTCHDIICRNCILRFLPGKTKKLDIYKSIGTKNIGIYTTPTIHNGITHYYRWFCSENCLTNYVVELDYHTWNKKPEIIQNIFDTQLLVYNELLKRKIYQYGNDIMISDLLNIVYEYSKEII